MKMMSHHLFIISEQQKRAIKTQRKKKIVVNSPDLYGISFCSLFKMSRKETPGFEDIQKILKLTTPIRVQLHKL